VVRKTCLALNQEAIDWYHLMSLKYRKTSLSKYLNIGSSEEIKSKTIPISSRSVNNLSEKPGVKATVTNPATFKTKVDRFQI